jgi:hypothetical protein
MRNKIINNVPGHIKTALASEGRAPSGKRDNGVPGAMERSPRTIDR